MQFYFNNSAEVVFSKKYLKWCENKFYQFSKVLLTPPQYFTFIKYHEIWNSVFHEIDYFCVSVMSQLMTTDKLYKTIFFYCLGNKLKP